MLGVIYFMANNNDIVPGRQNKSSEKKFFDKFSVVGGYDVFTERGYETIINTFKSMVPVRNNSLILELGCGTGAFTRRLNNIVNNVIGVDISMGSIRYASKSCDSMKFVSCDIENLPIRDQSVDVVMFSGVLHHFEDLDQSLKETYRVLKTNGYLFAFEPNSWNPCMWLYRSKSSPFHSQVGRTENERLISPKEMRYKLNQHGFSEVMVNARSGIPFKYVESKWIRLILPIYNFFDYILEWTWGSNKIGAFLFCCGKKI